MIIQYKNIFRSLFVIAIIGLLASCNTNRSIMKAPLKEEGAKYLFSQLKEHEIKFNTLSAKFSVHYSQGKNKTSFNGHLRIKKDSLIWLSISPVLGIEIARILITPDSVKVINRVDKTYYCEDFSFVTNYLNSALDFDMLQAFLTGNDFTFYEKGNWKTSMEFDLYKLATDNRHKLKRYAKKNNMISIPIQNTWLDPSSFKIQKMVIKELNPKHGKKLTAEYDNFFIVEKQMMPLHIDFEVKAEKKMDILINYSRVELDKELRYPFKISSKYERISLK